jgi:UDP-glucose 4-epimerase
MPKVLITGAYGFVGRHTSRQFASRGWQVSGIGHGSWSQDEWKAWGLREWHACDVTLDAMITYAGEPDVIVHCAGSGSVGFSMTHPYQDYARTVGSTLSVLEYVRMYSPKTRLVYPSSAAVYGNADSLPIREDFPMRPASPYGVHKCMAEQLCQSFARHFSVSTAIVRFFSIYGPDLRKQLLWDACNKITKGDLRFFGTGRELRDWLHVSDAAALLYAAAERTAPECPIINGGTGIGVAVKDIIQELISLLGGAGDPLFTDAARPGDPAQYVADIRRAGDMAWQPVLGWRAGLKDYADWYRRESP